jgi:hypothetical protein
MIPRGGAAFGMDADGIAGSETFQAERAIVVMENVYFHMTICRPTVRQS